MLKEFYTKAMPDTGIYCVAYNIPNTEPYIEEYVDSLDKAVEFSPTTEPLAWAPTVTVVAKAFVSSVLIP